MMNRRLMARLGRVLGGWVPALGLGAATVGETMAPPRAAKASTAFTNGASYVRFLAEGTSAGRVETAVRTFRNGQGIEVTLFAAVHVGDRAYYGELQKRFAAYDALLYEMIRDADQFQGGESVDTANPLSQLQIGMKRMLELEFQLEAIDYSPTNFVHADLDPTTFFRLQRERQESLLGLMLRVMMEEQARQTEGKGSPLSGFHLLMALMNPDRGYALKLVLGRQMSELEDQLAGIEKGTDGRGSVIVAARNEHAIEVLREQTGKGRRRLGIFYGAGHMADFEQRLAHLDFKPVREEWLTAWDIRPRRTPATSSLP